jgi:hypothetical protein
MGLDVKLSHDKQELEIWHDDGMVPMKKGDAAKFALAINEACAALENRKSPPAPKPWMWDKEVFAECGPCDGDTIGDMLCGGGIGGHEMYLKDLYSLRGWIDDVLDYHRREGCLNLKKLEDSDD